MNKIKSFFEKIFLPLKSQIKWLKENIDIDLKNYLESGGKI